MTLNAAITFQAFSSVELNVRLTTLDHINPCFILYIYIYSYCSALCFCLYLLCYLYDDYCYCTFYNVYSVIYTGPKGRIARKLIVLPSQNNV